ncbi:hypothetical protein BGZ73_008140 [Actinomortierella ambigua]|nr:hypothetical protein BGZ73_008140 [Actinomortierella ambigua]
MSSTAAAQPMACTANLLPATELPAPASRTDTLLPSPSPPIPAPDPNTAPTPSDAAAAVNAGPTWTSSLHTQPQPCATDQYTPSLKLAEEINEINQLKTTQTVANLTSSKLPTSSIFQSSISAGISSLLAQTATSSKSSMPPNNASQHPFDTSAPTTATISASTAPSEPVVVTVTTGPDADANADVDADTSADATAARTLRRELNWVNAVPSHFDASSPNPRKRRRRTNRAELAVLEDAFARNLLPDAATRQELGQRLGMSVRAVQIWFQNRRQSLRKKSSSMQNLHTLSLESSSAESLIDNTATLSAEAHMHSSGLSLDTFKNRSADDEYVSESGPLSSSSTSSISDSSMAMSPPMPLWQRPSSEEDDGLDKMNPMLERAKSCSDLLLSRQRTGTLLLRSDIPPATPSLTSSLSTLSCASESSTASDSTTLPPLASLGTDNDQVTPSRTRTEPMDPIVEEPTTQSSDPVKDPQSLIDRLNTFKMTSAKDSQQQQQYAASPMSEPPTEPIGTLVDEKLAQHHLSLLLQEAKKNPAVCPTASASVATITTLKTVETSQHPHAPVLASWDASADSKPVLNAFGRQGSVSVAAYTGSTSHPRSLSAKKLVRKGSSSSSLLPLAPSSMDVSKATSSSTMTTSLPSTSLSLPTSVSSPGSVSPDTKLTINANTINSNNNAPRRYHYTKSRPKSLMEMVIHRQREQQREQQLQRQMQQALETQSPSLSTSEWPQRLPRPKKKSHVSHSQANTSGGHGSIASSNFRQSAVLASKQGRAASVLAYPEYPAEFHPLHLKQKRPHTSSLKPTLSASHKTMASALLQSSTYRDQGRAKTLEAESMMTTNLPSNNLSTKLHQLLRDNANSSDSDSDALPGSSPSLSAFAIDPAKPSPILPEAKVVEPSLPPVKRPKAFFSTPSLDTVCSWSQLKRVQSDSVLLAHPFLIKSADKTTVNSSNAFAATGQRAQRARRLEIGRDLFQSDSDATEDQTEEEEDGEEEEVKVKQEEEELKCPPHRFPTASLSKLTGKHGRSMTMQHLPTTITSSPTTTTNLKRGRKTASSRPTLHHHHHHHHRPLDTSEGEPIDEIERRRASRSFYPHHEGGHHHYDSSSSFAYAHQDEDDDAIDDDENLDDTLLHRRHRRRVSTSTTTSSGHSRQSSSGGAEGADLAVADKSTFRPPPMGIIPSTATASTMTNTSLPPVGYFSPPRASTTTSATTVTSPWRPTSPPSPAASLVRGNLEVEDDQMHFMHQRRPSSSTAAATPRRPVVTPLSPTTPSPTRPQYNPTGPPIPFTSLDHLYQHHHRTQSLDPLSAMADMALGEHEQGQDTSKAKIQQSLEVSSTSTSTLNKDELECASVLAGLGWCR